MAGRRIAKSTNIKKQGFPWTKLILALTLLPMVTGVMMIFGWGLDVTVFISPEVQLQVGILMILLAFAVSNAAQKNWLISLGWLLFAVADFLLVMWVSTIAQVIAFTMGGLGVILLGYEIYRRSTRPQKPAKKAKTTP